MERRTSGEGDARLREELLRLGQRVPGAEPRERRLRSPERCRGRAVLADPDQATATAEQGEGFFRHDVQPLPDAGSLAEGCGRLGGEALVLCDMCVEDS